MRRYTLLIKTFPRLLAVLLVLTLMMTMASAAFAAEQSGTCGEDLEWSFADGTLTITGSGKMTDFTEGSPAPWHGFRDRILRLELPDGLTSIGTMAFDGCMALVSVDLPDSVREIGAIAFNQCYALAIVRLPEGLTAIGRSAFEACCSLQDLRLPPTLTTLGERAFYRCTSLTYVTIPESVSSMGVSVFSYCESLLRANVLATLAELPTWTFYGCKSLGSIYLPGSTNEVGDYALYGCEKLTEVYYGGTLGDAEKLQEQITESRHQGTDTTGGMTPEDAGNSESYNGAQVDENGDVIVTDTTVTQTENSTITTTTETNISNEEAEQPPTEIGATIVTDEGWEELKEAIEDALENGGVNVEVYLPNDTEIPPELLEELAAKDVWMEVTTSKGDFYTLDFQKMEDLSVKKPLDLSYTLTLAEDVKYEQLQGLKAYRLTFAESSQVPVGVAIQLPLENLKATASLYQVRGGKLEHLQAAVVDLKGMVHFYLASVDKGTTYFVGINIPGVSISDANIPKELENDYGITEQIRDVDYVITGRKSSWGIGFLEVNKILIGFMLSTAAIVGLVMYSLNKRKLRRGVMPGWEDDEDDEN